MWPQPKFSTLRKNVKIISRTIFSSLGLKSVANNSSIQETLACADTTLSLLYYVNKSVCRHTRVCVCLHTQIGVHVQWLTTNNTISPHPYCPLSYPHFLYFSYITARCPRPNLHFPSFAPLPFFFLLSSSFYPHSSLLLFKPPFVVEEGVVQNMKGGAMWMPGICVEAHMVAVILATISQLLLFSR